LEKSFYSNGKLLITGEYVVLDGAKALAIPTKFGQYLNVENGQNQEIQWTSFDADGSVWFQEVISFSDVSNKPKSGDQSIKNTLIEILHEAFLLNPDFINNSEGYIITTRLTFPKFWGLGTSSTLLNNIAQWLEINAFELLKNSFGGSGYDIACAQNNLPVIYQLINGKPTIEPIHFNPVFSENLYFVYLNQKQSSKSAIASYHKKQNNLNKIIPEIDNITNAILNGVDLEIFTRQLEKHEAIISMLLETKTVKENFFPDFNGVIKSLGAWGGDFVLVISKEDPSTYFKSNGFETIVPYKDMILT
jgi:mevalonate kinase